MTGVRNELTNAEVTPVTNPGDCWTGARPALCRWCRGGWRRRRLLVACRPAGARSPSPAAAPPCRLTALGLVKYRCSVCIHKLIICKKKHLPPAWHRLFFYVVVAVRFVLAAVLSSLSCVFHTIHSVSLLLCCDDTCWSVHSAPPPISIFVISIFNQIFV